MCALLLATLRITPLGCNLGGLLGKACLLSVWFLKHSGCHSRYGLRPGLGRGTRENGRKVFYFHSAFRNGPLGS